MERRKKEWVVGLIEGKTRRLRSFLAKNASPSLVLRASRMTVFVLILATAASVCATKGAGMTLRGSGQSQRDKSKTPRAEDKQLATKIEERSASDEDKTPGTGESLC